MGRRVVERAGRDVVGRRSLAAPAHAPSGANAAAKRHRGRAFIRADGRRVLVARSALRPGLERDDCGVCCKHAPKLRPVARRYIWQMAYLRRAGGYDCVPARRVASAASSTRYATPSLAKRWASSVLSAAAGVKVEPVRVSVRGLLRRQQPNPRGGALNRHGRPVELDARSRSDQPAARLLAVFEPCENDPWPVHQAVVPRLRVRGPFPPAGDACRFS
jgi:hypothetical protein